MEYNRVNWKDFPDTSTKMSAENFNKMDEGIAEAAEEINANKEKIDELSSQLANQETIILDVDTDPFTVQPKSYKYLMCTPPQKEGYRLLSVTPRDTSGENSAYLLINARNSGSIIVYNVESVAVECVITLRYLYKKF